MKRCSIVLAASMMFISALAADINIVFTGDILLDRGVRRVIERRGVDHLFTGGIDSIFRSAQVVVGNLECPATKIVSPVQKLFIFRAEPEWLTTLRSHGITHLNLANNHSIDQGREGLMDTRRNIIAAGITPIGAGQNMAEASQPVLLASQPRNVWLVPSLRLALENYSYLTDRPCVSQEPMDSLLNRVHRLRKADSTAVIIVSLHWGGEHTLKPVNRQRWDAHHRGVSGQEDILQHRQFHLRPHPTAQQSGLHGATTCERKQYRNRDHSRRNSQLRTHNRRPFLIFSLKLLHHYWIFVVYLSAELI